MSSKIEQNTEVDSGLVIKTIRPGDATHYPRPPATCRIHYVGKLPDGTIFDSSRARSRPLLFRLGNEQLIPGLEHGIQMMSIGQISQMILPPHLAYGSTGYLPVIPPNCTLTYEVELIAFNIEEGEHLPQKEVVADTFPSLTAAGT
uniref:peptidylprolyl isomerase n=1 Tax=Aureoumbra lagunensis TaxID=44058 RepID=A0A7S3K4C4_9STRA|mmetsp:Transcript_23222/g.30071  ORF Transcript_23222/g.30071 Transcript_23222/m.30071 type:complete len:146 (+) Transcript_23222:100-537(+)